MTFLSAPLTATPRRRPEVTSMRLAPPAPTGSPAASAPRPHDAGGLDPRAAGPGGAAARGRAGLPLRAWRAAGRILGRAGLRLAAAGRAG